MSSYLKEKASSVMLLRRYFEKLGLPPIHESGFVFVLLIVLVFFVHLIEEFFYGKIMDCQKPAEAFNRHICPSFLNSPILHAGQIVVVREIFVTAITFCLSQNSKFRTNANEGIT